MSLIKKDVQITLFINLFFSWDSLVVFQSGQKKQSCPLCVCFNSGDKGRRFWMRGQPTAGSVIAAERSSQE